MSHKDYYVQNGDKLVAIFYVPYGVKDNKIIPNGTKVIGKEACREINGFKKLIIPEGVVKIESGAFYGNESLEELYLPESLIEVEDGAFAGCTSLKYMHYGEHTTFGSCCFSKCCSLKWIECGGVKARTFYFTHSNRFSITIEQPELYSPNCKAYLGRFTKDGFPTEAPNFEYPPLYFCETDDGQYFWYADTLEECKEALAYQSSGKSFSDYFHRELSFDGSITPREFSYLTGICWAGRRGWLQMFGGTDNTSFSVAHVIGVLETRYPQVCQRLIYGINHQHEAGKILTIDKGVSIAEFVENLKREIGEK